MSGNFSFFDQVIAYLNKAGNLLRDVKAEFGSIESNSFSDGVSKEIIRHVNETVIKGMDNTISNISTTIVQLNKMVEAGEQEDLANLPSKKKKNS